MLRTSRWKIISVVLLIVFSLFTLLPSLLSGEMRGKVKAYLPSWIPFETVVLGLDLQGGAHLLYEVDEADVVKTLIGSLRDDVRRVLREEGIRLAGGIASTSKGVQFRLMQPEDQTKILPKLQSWVQARAGLTSLGMTSSPGLEMIETPEGMIRLEITPEGIKDRIRRAVEQTIEVLNRRVNNLGTTEPNIQRVGDRRILVEVPGLQDTNQLKEIVGTTAKLEFRLVPHPGAAPNEFEMLPQVEGGGMLPVEKRVIVQGEDLVDAQPRFSAETQEPVVTFRFNITGGQKFGQVTQENIGRLFAIVLDNKVISAPRIQSPILGGSGQITGRFTVEQANNLSILLRAGALPARLTIVEERTVGPGLGQDSIEAGKMAAYIAALLVVVYMVLNYGLFGLFADIALAIHIALIFSALILLQATLTLPGIAGIVFTIGMAVDSNVLIYERIREEAKMGRSVISALDAGFLRAFATIVDSNATMMVAAVILYLCGSGPVRGFAVSLALGIITTIVTAVTMTRMMIAVWYQWTKSKTLPI